MCVYVCMLVLLLVLVLVLGIEHLFVETHVSMQLSWQQLEPTPFS